MRKVLGLVCAGMFLVKVILIFACRPDFSKSNSSIFSAFSICGFKRLKSLPVPIGRNVFISVIVLNNISLKFFGSLFRYLK